MDRPGRSPGQGVDPATPGPGTVEGTEAPTASPARRFDPVWAAGVTLVGLVALALRVAHLIEIRADDPFFSVLSADPLVFHEWAVRMSGGDWFGDSVFFMGPLYPYLLGVLYSLFGADPMVGYIWQAALGVLTCVLTAVVGRRIGGREVGIVAGLTMCLYGQAIFFGGVLLIVNLLTPLALIAVWLMLRGVEAGSWRTWFAAGLAVGLMVLGRPNALLLVALIPLALAVATLPTDRRWFTRRRGDPRSASSAKQEQAPASSPRTVNLEGTRTIPLTRAAPAFLLGAALAILPATVHNIVVGGDFALVTAHGGTNLYVGNNAHAEGVYMIPPEVEITGPMGPIEQAEAFAVAAMRHEGRPLRPSEVSRYWSSRARDALLAHPAHALRLWLRKLELALNHTELTNVQDIDTSRPFSWVLRLPLVGFGLIAPLAILGIAVRARELRQDWPLVLFIAANFASLVIVFVASRYRMPVVPLLAVYAAVGGSWIVGRARAIELRRLAAGAALAILAALFVNRDLMHQEAWVGQFNLGSAYYEKGDFDSAIRTWIHTVKEKPDFVPAHEGLARAFEEVGETALACTAWEVVDRVGRRDGAMASVVLSTARRAALGCGPRRQSAEAPDSLNGKAPGTKPPGSSG